MVFKQNSNLCAFSTKGLLLIFNVFFNQRETALLLLSGAFTLLIPISRPTYHKAIAF